MKEKLMLLFSVNKFDRGDLNKMSEDELYDLASFHDDSDTMVFELQEFCDYCNDQEINIDKWWLYTINL